MCLCNELGPDHQSDLINDGLPVLDPLCEMQAAIAQAYATLLVNLAQQHAAASPIEKVGLSILLERFQYDAPWAVSEVRRSNEFKIRRQRYISQDVFDNWRKIQIKPRRSLGKFAKDAAGKTLIHEHVVQRKGLGVSLRGLTDGDRVMALLLSVTACIVSEKEDDRLRNVKDVDGWDRYLKADPPIGVYDRKMKCWVVPRQDAQGMLP